MVDATALRRGTSSSVRERQWKVLFKLATKPKRTLCKMLTNRYEPGINGYRKRLGRSTNIRRLVLNVADEHGRCETAIIATVST